ncbi:MAG: F0F1 ATP synthase subunit alpha [Planctomycetes bacterium]|nr:F0F1 ATP synthase subunit alpha [Planctomycetota bacterium]
MLNDVLERADGVLAQVLGQPPDRLRVRQAGTIERVGDGIAVVRGLPEARAGEVLRFPGGGSGLVFNLDPDGIGAVLLDETPEIRAGAEVLATGRVIEVPVGDALLGRVVNPLGRPLDGQGPVPGDIRLPAERPARAIVERAPVTRPMLTGIKCIDTLLSIGRGQRELILGDRQTGKTSIALDAILNQTDGVICVYASIGQQAAAVAKVIAALRAREALAHTVIVVATSSALPGLQVIAPFAAASIAEAFMEKGRDVLVIYDDLTKHANAYRQVSLLLRRPPGREAFPGDIFYLHSRLLERATQLREDLGGGSVTALPIIETQAGNLSAYIPTNVISITDGQIYLDPDLFHLGQMPAIDVGLSVSRVGAKAQLPALGKLGGTLRLSYSQFQELEIFSRFGARLEPETRKAIERGRRIREALKQPRFQPIQPAEQVAILFAAAEGILDPVPLDRVREAEAALREAVRRDRPEIAQAIEAGEKLSDEAWGQLAETARGAVAAFEENREETTEAPEEEAEGDGDAPGD